MNVNTQDIVFGETDLEKRGKEDGKEEEVDESLDETVSTERIFRP